MRCAHILVLTAILAASFAGRTDAGQTAAIRLRSFSVEGQSLQGSIQGPWEWTGGVTVSGSGMIVKADTLKLWLTPDGRDAERAEASGNIRIEGEYITSDKTRWEIEGRAERASYEGKARQGVLSGSVSFKAKNQTTGAVLSAGSDKLFYDFETQHFRFERNDAPVRMEWQEPVSASPPTEEIQEPTA